jgi:hypothetical protein
MEHVIPWHLLKSEKLCLAEHHCASDTPKEMAGDAIVNHEIGYTMTMYLLSQIRNIRSLAK